jgi:hypothetical protein
MILTGKNEGLGHQAAKTREMGCRLGRNPM